MKGLSVLDAARACQFGIGLGDLPAAGRVEIPERLARAVEKRRLEYQAGRYCAEHALVQLGAAGPVGIGTDRAPIWPHGIVGSISHSRKRAFAVVARDVDLRAVGADVEELIEARVVEEIGSRILKPAELEMLEDAGYPEQLAVTIGFSVKESIYKCQYPGTGRMLDFPDITLLAADGGELAFRIDGDTAHPMQAHFEARESYVLSAALERLDGR